MNKQIIRLTLFTLMFTLSIAANGQHPFIHKMQFCKPALAADSVYCGSYDVFENHESKQGRKISLNVMVIPAINSSTKRSPVFYFDGGPGVAATKNIDFFSERSNPYRQSHDIVLVDIRGTGGSNPLHCYSLQYQLSLAEHFDEHDPRNEMYPVNEVKACYDSLSKTADLTQYTTTNIVQDIEEVRKWLGYEKIIAFGLSYGTRLTQEYMRRFPASIEAGVLFSPTSTGSKMPLYHALFAQNTLNKLIDDCTSNPLCAQAYPELKKDFNSLMVKMRSKPLVIQEDSLTLSIPWNAFQTKIRSQMYQPVGLRQLPYIIHEAANNNWKPFLNLYSKQSQFSDFSAEGLYLSITCAEDVPFISKKERKRMVKNTFMGDYRVAQQKQACAMWVRGKIPSDFLQPVKSNIPVLILAGEWDPVTPVSMAKEIARHLPKSQLIVVPEMSHLPWGLSNDNCLDEMILDFIITSGTEKVKSDCIYTMKPGSYKVR